MQKEIHIIKGTLSEDYRSFTSRMLVLCDQVLEQSQPEILKVTLTTSAPPAISVIPFRRTKVAVLSIS